MWVRHISRKTISLRLGYVRDESMNLILDVCTHILLMQGYGMYIIGYRYLCFDRKTHRAIA